MVDWGNSSLYMLIADMSFGAWVNLTSAAQSLIVWRGKADGSPVAVDNDNYKLSPTASGGKWNLRYVHEYGSANSETLDFAAQLASDKWYYAAFSRDSVAKTVSLWVGDGVTLTLVSTQSYSNAPTDGTGSGCHLVIGNFVQDGTFTPGALNGAVQQHYLWNRKTTLAEQSLAMTGNPPTSGLILACTMGNSPEVDLSGNGGSGTVTGTIIVSGH